jgi:ethanolamine permease
VGKASDPLFLALKTIFGDGLGASLLALVAVAGLVASFHTIIFAYGRNIYSLSRAGYFPHWLSVTHGTRKTPHVALIAGAVLGFVICLIIQNSEAIFGDVPVGAVLLNMAVFGAVIAYILQMVSFVILRRKLPHMPRPYVSLFGEAGAIIAAIIAAVTLVTLLVPSSGYIVGIYGVALWYIAGIIYFAVYGRHKLVYSPEEEFAVKNAMNAAD